MDYQVFAGVLLVVLICGLIAALCAEKRKAHRDVENGSVAKRARECEERDEQAGKGGASTNYQKFDNDTKRTNNVKQNKFVEQDIRYGTDGSSVTKTTVPDAQQGRNAPANKAVVTTYSTYTPPAVSEVPANKPAVTHTPYTPSVVSVSSKPANTNKPPTTTPPSANKPATYTPPLTSISTPANKAAPTASRQPPAANKPATYTQPLTSTSTPTITPANKPATYTQPPTSILANKSAPYTQPSASTQPAANKPTPATNTVAPVANKPANKAATGGQFKHTPVAPIAYKAPVGGNPKINGLMQWIQQCTQGYAHVNITNFTTAWKDGMAFCALAHHFNPCFDYDALSPNKPAYNLKLAIELAEKMGVPRLSDPEDYLDIEVPDRLSTITYLFGWLNTLGA